MKTKIASLNQVLEKIEDGQTIMFSGLHGIQAADEIIDGMLEKGVKDITAVGIAAGNPRDGVGKLITAKRVKKVITSHTGLNPEAIKQMLAGELEVEYVPQGTWIERIHAGGAGLGGCLTPTGVGTEVEEGKQKLTIDGKEYLLELPIKADVGLFKAWKADKAGNIKFRLNGLIGHDEMALASAFPIFEVDEIVEIGELGPEDIDIPAPITGYVYQRKNGIPNSWRTQIEKTIEEKAKGGK